MGLSGKTRVACVIGYPVSHSLSPVMHNAAFGHLGIDAVYVAFHVAPKSVATAVAAVRDLALLGANITVPHKESILSHLDSISARARRVGAVNTIVPRRGKLLGENTDVPGFQRALEDEDVELAGRRVLLLGAGGAARAVALALRDAGVSRVVIANRTINRAQSLARDFSSKRTRMEAISLPEAAALGDPEQFDLVVNSTSLGLTGGSFPDVPFERFSESTLFYDLIPRRSTPFLEAARSAQRRAVDGLGMLLHQGAVAFELWTGQPAPVDVMRRALRQASRS